VTRPPDVALAATLHDPPGALAELVEDLLPAVAATWRGVAVATSPPTSARVRRLLARTGMHAGTPPGNRRGPLYRLSLRAALATGAARVQYLDFDRVLHWLARAPRELRAALRAATQHELLVLGRTPAAHRSHQLPLYATETLVNRIMAARLGVLGRLDVLVPSFVATRAVATALRARSRARDGDVYGEWPALLFGLASEVAYLECRGLDWETPDRHRKAVRRVGLPAWRRRWDRPAEWDLRIDLARDIVRGFERTAARHPPREGAPRRLTRRG
jgi:hypothetical protein